MAGEKIMIECLDDGSYRVTSTEEGGEPGDQPLDQTVKTLDEVLGLVQQELSDDTGMDEGMGKQAWDKEAAGRDATGYRQASGTPSMSM